MEDQTSIAYLGPAGTYHEEAAVRFAERLHCDEPRMTACNTFNDVFDAVERGRCNYGVVAMENSLEGPVTASLDAFAFRNTVEILGEQVIDVHHCLVMHPDAKLEDIEIIATHPQGLAQCRHYLLEHFPAAKRMTTSSTAESARIASENIHVAGIANSRAAELYGAKIYERNIEDHAENQTCFALIAQQGHPQVFTGSTTKTSLALFLRVDRTGALMMILSEFAYAGINMTKIQSRPTKQALGDYMFFVDIEGSVMDPYVQTALNCLRLKLREVKVLGSYPID